MTPRCFERLESGGWLVDGEAKVTKYSCKVRIPALELGFQAMLTS